MLYIPVASVVQCDELQLTSNWSQLAAKSIFEPAWWTENQWLQLCNSLLLHLCASKLMRHIGSCIDLLLKSPRLIFNYQGFRYCHFVSLICTWISHRRAAFLMIEILTETPSFLSQECKGCKGKEQNIFSVKSVVWAGINRRTTERVYILFYTPSTGSQCWDCKNNLFSTT